MENFCTLCPRNCRADRAAGNGGFCGAPADIRVARASLHMWEEPCISGWRGSGTVFFVGCNLKCVYCQNYAIAQGKTGIGQTGYPDKAGVGVTDGSEITKTGGTVLPGKSLSPEELADVFLRLEAAGAHNINLVTAAHFVPGVRDALIRAKDKGLSIPVVYNSSGYELPETLRMLDGLIDIYMPDFKYMSPKLAARYSHAPDYPEVAKAALQEMFRQVGRPVFIQMPPKESGSGNKVPVETPGSGNKVPVETPGSGNKVPVETSESDNEVSEKTSESGDERKETMGNGDFRLLRRGMLVRYLLLPGCVIDGKRILKYLYETWQDDIWISIMNQYTPQPAQLRDFPELNRKVMGREYDSLLDYALRLGIQNAYMQEGEAAKESFIPDFRDSGLLAAETYLTHISRAF